MQHLQACFSFILSFNPLRFNLKNQQNSYCEYHDFKLENKI